ncbi:MAG: hypothetical protein M0Z33_07970, partial [Actinomycetota bacterium]|nr:hypothetical protein [Actinomycetota bacterium]
MRTHPLLALFTTTITLTSTGLVAGSLAGTGPATPLVGRTTAHGPAPDPDARGLPYGQPPAAESTRAAGVEHDPVLAASPALLPRRLLLRTPALGEPG